MKWLAIAAIALWIICGFIVLRPKNKPSKVDYACCWITLLLNLILNSLKYF